VLQARIARGVSDRIKTCFGSAICATIRASRTARRPKSTIPLLNDYADAIVSTIHQHSDDVLKLIDDGLLAIFHAEDRARACAAALDAVQDARESLETSTNAPGRKACQRPTCISGSILAWVVYGNIGSEERLNFTVVGPVVNEVARIAALCRSVDQPILMSSSFASSVAEDRRRLASVGRFALRGVGEPQELYTLDTRG
jgi:adenylate cyclase